MAHPRGPPGHLGGNRVPVRRPQGGDSLPEQLVVGRGKPRLGGSPPVRRGRGGRQGEGGGLEGGEGDLPLVGELALGEAVCFNIVLDLEGIAEDSLWLAEAKDRGLERVQTKHKMKSNTD